MIYSVDPNRTYDVLEFKGYAGICYGALEGIEANELIIDCSEKLYIGDDLFASIEVNKLTFKSSIEYVHTGAFSNSVINEISFEGAVDDIGYYSLMDIEGVVNIPAEFEDEVFINRWATVNYN